VSEQEYVGYAKPYDFLAAGEKVAMKRDRGCARMALENEPGGGKAKKKTRGACLGFSF
jgi:hypothetical protein